MIYYYTKLLFTDKNKDLMTCYLYQCKSIVKRGISKSSNYRAKAYSLPGCLYLLEFHLLNTLLS